LRRGKKNDKRYGEGFSKNSMKKKGGERRWTKPGGPTSLKRRESPAHAKFGRKKARFGRSGPSPDRKRKKDRVLLRRARFEEGSGKKEPPMSSFGIGRSNLK